MWLLALAAGTVDACLESLAHPVEETQTASTHRNGIPHEHELAHCNDTFNHAAVTARTLNGDNDPRTPLALPASALFPSATQPQRTLRFAQPNEPAPAPNSLYLRTARLRI